MVGLVIVRYSTGNTFGQSCGEWEVIGTYQDLDKADEVVKSIKDDTYDEKYPCWKGYFESLESVDVHIMRITG